MSQRRARPHRGIHRKSGKKKPKIKIIAFCEGKNTEPYYLKKFVEIHGNQLVTIEPVRAAGVPKTIVDKAVLKKKELVKAARKTGDPLDKSFEVWAVFDCDEHPYIPESFEKAKGNNLKVAYSNPCFEVWLYLHKSDQSAAIHRKALGKQLQKLVPSYDPDRAKTLCPSIFTNDEYEKAKQRAQQLKTSHDSVGAGMACPYTDVYELLEVIIANGK